ncbi:hypothetical protein [Cohaesibacter gelatinilyticus]|uniref:Uncharacterized protein n=1 Tax=Cohaesibacter gelatinilyticus TaxID=372072 RepID=A0A285PHM8_9HYPH|nr:hypothetical protein [Cohaesibacter gelatinilyticus]SNZ21240.1 hypothetical protein SAMN06265368_4357 [Cohaesibacter gelatinilyticus]
MISIVKKKAEERLAAIQKAQQAILNEQEEQASEVRKNTARLKAQRLAREKAEQDLASQAKSGQGAKKRK